MRVMGPPPWSALLDFAEVLMIEFKARDLTLFSQIGRHPLRS